MDSNMFKLVLCFVEDFFSRAVPRKRNAFFRQHVMKESLFI